MSTILKILQKADRETPDATIREILETAEGYDGSHLDPAARVVIDSFTRDMERKGHSYPRARKCALDMIAGMNMEEVRLGAEAAYNRTVAELKLAYQE